MRKSELTSRLKENYELRARHYFPRRTYTLVRVDGRAFHTWTRGLSKPYDLDLMRCMDATATRLCEEMAGAHFAFVQSDEISVLLTDFADIKTAAWFDGCQNKIESVSASIATMTFNLNITVTGLKRLPTAMFDARAWTIPDPIEVENYFIDRQQDAERNSVMMLARSYASHKQLAGKKRADQHEIIHKAGDNWAKHPVRFKHGAVVRRTARTKEQLEQAVAERGFPVESHNWLMDDKTPVFTKERDYLRKLVPIIWDDDLLVRKAVANG